MNRLEYLAASSVLRLLGALFDLLPVRRRVVLASARGTRLEGNLLYVNDALRRLHPELRPVLLLEPYGYGLRAKLGYLLRLVRGMFYLRTSSLFIVDNAYFPIHVAPHQSRTTVVQVWHAVGALKRFGVDTARPLAEPEQTFLHRHYDNVVVSSEATRQPVARALRTPAERVLALGTPRTDFFFDEAAMAAARERLLADYPVLRDRRVVLYAPTFRGRGKGRWAAAGLDAVKLRAQLPTDYALVLKAHPNLDPGLSATDGFDVVADPALDINELLTLTDILVTDYSSSIFEWALLRRPLVLLVGDLADYERDPGLYLDVRREMIGAQASDTDAVAAAILAEQFDLTAYEAFIERHLGACDGHASERLVSLFFG